MQFAVRVDGSKIKEARLEVGMSQAQLARAIGTSENNIGRWESSQNQPRIESIAAIANATGHDIDFFLTGSTEAEEDEEAASLTLDAYLRVQVRRILREELESLK